MIKALKVFCLLIFISVTLFAQDRRPTPNKVPSELETLISFGSQGMALIMLDDLERPTKLGLRFFNLEEELVAEKTIDLKRQGLLTQFEGAFAWNGELVILSSLYYPGPKRNHLIFQKFSVPDFEEQMLELIDEAYSPEFFRVPFGFKKSPKGEYLLFYSWTYTLPEDPAKVSIKVYNKEMELVWTERYLLPMLNKTFYIFDCEVNDQGRAFLFCENYDGKPGKFIDEKKINYFILAGEKGNKNLIEYKLNLEGRTITGLKVQLDTSGAIVGAAFIKDEKKKLLIGGLYLFHIPADGKTINRSQMPLTKDMYKAAYPYGEKESILTANRHKFNNFLIDYIFVEEDGSWVIAGEYRREDPNYFDLQFNDILVVKTSANRNRVEWLKRIPKRQDGIQGNWNVFSYKAFHKKNNYFFIFNDALANHKQEGDPKVLVEYNGTKAAVLLMQLNANGELFKIDLTDLARKKNVAAIWPARSWEINNKKNVALYGDQPLKGGGTAGLLFYFGWGKDLR